MNARKIREIMQFLETCSESKDAISSLWMSNSKLWSISSNDCWEKLTSAVIEPIVDAWNLDDQGFSWIWSLSWKN